LTEHSPGGPPLDPTVARTGRIAISAMFLLNGAILGSWAPQIPLLLPRHGITESTLGLLIFGMGIGAMAAMFLSGRLTARHGSRAMVRVTALACAVTLPLAVLAPSVATLALAMVAMGGSIAMMDVATNANAVEIEHATGRAILSSTHGFWSVGGFLGGALGGPGIAALGPAGHALTVGALSLAVVALSWRGLVRVQVGDEAADGGTGPGIWRQGWTIYLIGLMALMSFVPESAVLDWSALYLSSDHGAGVAASGMAFALFSACMAAMRFCGDAVRNRVGAVPLLRASGILAAAGMTLAALAPSPALAIAGFALCGIGLANLVPILFSAAGRHGGADPGAAIAAVSFIGYGGMLVAPSLIGVTAEHVGFPAIFTGLAALLLAVAALAPVVAPGREGARVVTTSRQKA
jgi:predicted MFS family arabinose efflux permease